MSAIDHRYTDWPGLEEATPPVLVEVLVALAIIAGCAFFVAQEVAYVPVDRCWRAAKAKKRR